jgi:hypothetical protein
MYTILLYKQNMTSLVYLSQPQNNNSEHHTRRRENLKSHKCVVFCWCLATQAYLPGRLLLHQLLYMGPWYLIELSAMMFPPSSVILFYPYGKTNGLILWTTNCTCWNHSYSHGIPPSVSEVMEEKAVLTCLQIGHMHLTHSHLLRGELGHVCINCGVPLIVSHILLDWILEYLAV